MDPLAEKYYHITPYSYCGGDPVNAMDKDGRRVLYAKGVSEEFKMSFSALVKYMNSQGTAGDLAEIEDSKKIYYINEATSPLQSKFSAEGGIYNIYILI